MQGTKVQAFQSRWGALALVVGLAGCGGGSFSSDSSADAGSSESDAGTGEAGAAGASLAGAAGVVGAVGGQGGSSGAAASVGGVGGAGASNGGASGAQQTGGAAGGGAGGVGGAGGEAGAAGAPVAVDWCGQDWLCVVPIGSACDSDNGNYGDVGGNTYAQHCELVCRVNCQDETPVLEGRQVFCEFRTSVGADNEDWCNCRCGVPLSESVTEP